MPSFANLTLVKKISGLLRACTEWIRQHSQFGHPKEAPSADTAPPYTPGWGGEYSWVFDPQKKYWVMEMNFSFRSLKCRVQAGEAEPPPGIQSLRRIMRIIQ